MRTIGYLTPAAWLLALTLPGCTSDDVSGLDDDDVTVTESEPVSPEAYTGSRGLVIDTREIFRKGYVPVEAAVSFPDHPELDAVLPIDRRTNLAILAIENDSLSEGQRLALSSGVRTTIVVSDSAGALSILEADQVLDASNRPIRIFTSEPYVLPRVTLHSAIPFLMQIEDTPGVLTHVEVYYQGTLYDRYRQSEPYPDTLSADVPDADRESRLKPHGQEFFFTPLTDSTYVVRHGPAPTTDDVEIDRGPDLTWCNARLVGLDVIMLLDRTATECLQVSEIQVVQDDDGWVRLKDLNTQLYVSWKRASSIFPELGLLRLGSEGDRFRFLADNIDWDLQDLGTSYNLPIKPSARIAFAYQATIRNCSLLEVTDVIGRTQTRETTTTTTTLESVQLFGSRTFKFSVHAEFEYKAQPKGVGARVQVGGSFGGSNTTSTTLTTDNSLSISTVESVTISRERTVVVPPYTAVRATDIVRAVDDIVTPWTQALRITARHRGRSLSGREIVTHLRFNLFGALISKVGADFVDASVRGQSIVDQALVTETELVDVPGACS